MIGFTSVSDRPRGDIGGGLQLCAELGLKEQWASSIMPVSRFRDGAGPASANENLVPAIAPNTPGTHAGSAAATTAAVKRPTLLERQSQLSEQYVAKRVSARQLSSIMSVSVRCSAPMRCSLEECCPVPTHEFPLSITPQLHSFTRGRICDNSGMLFAGNTRRRLVFVPAHGQNGTHGPPEQLRSASSVRLCGCSQLLLLSGLLSPDRCELLPVCRS
jgi:hypothetical protein